MIKEFNSLQEKKQFEADRINYYLNRIGVSPFECYKNIFIETFTKEGRRLKTLYDGYEGGYYRDENGYVHADHVCLLPLNEFQHGTIVIEDSTERVYIKNNNEDIFCYTFDEILKDTPLTVTKNIQSDVCVIKTEPSYIAQEAKWEINCDGYYPYCTNCNNEPKSGLMTQYCPSCGAKMSNPKE